MDAGLSEQIDEDVRRAVNHERAERKARHTIHETAKTKDGADPVKIAVAGEPQAIEKIERADPRRPSSLLRRDPSFANRTPQRHLPAPFADLPGEKDEPTVSLKGREPAPRRPWRRKFKPEFGHSRVDSSHSQLLHPGAA